MVIGDDDDDDNDYDDDDDDDEDDDEDDDTDDAGAGRNVELGRKAGRVRWGSVRSAVAAVKPPPHPPNPIPHARAVGWRQEQS